MVWHFKFIIVNITRGKDISKKHKQTWREFNKFILETCTHQQDFEN